VRAFDLPTPLPAPLAGLGVADAKAAPAPAPAQPARHAAAEGAPAGAPADIHIPGGPGHAPEPPGPAPIVQHGANVWRLAMKGATIAASSSQDGTVVVFDHHARTHLMTFNTLSKEKGHNVVGGAMGVAFTPDGRIVYTGISDEQAPLESRPVQVRPA
jgi:hypothetical protein